MKMSRTLAKDDLLGAMIRWFECICASCGESLFVGMSATKADAIRQARSFGWRITKSPAGELWECNICIAVRAKAHA